MAYIPQREWVIEETELTLTSDNGHFLYMKTPLSEASNIATLIASETHIDPARDEGYMIYKIGYVQSVANGRSISMLWGNEKKPSFDWLTVEPTKVTINRDLHVVGNIIALYGFRAGLAGVAYLEMLADLVSVKKNMGSESYASGFAGSGWRMDQTDNRLTVDYLTVRKEMSVYELIINQIRSTNGALWVSDAAKIASVVDGGSYWKCNLDTDGGNAAPPFVADDWIRCQKWTGRGVKYYSAKVTSVGADYFNITKTGIDGAGTPAAGDTVVRIGNATNSSRQGAIYLTSSDNNSPYLDVLDGVNSASLEGKTKVRLGRLDGITDPQFGNLEGYGLFGENAYIKGKIQVTGGNAETITGAQAKVDAIQVGGRNLVLNSKQTITGTQRLNTFYLSEPLVVGETYTATMNGRSGEGATFQLWVNYASQSTVRILQTTDTTVSKTFVYEGAENEFRVTVYSEESENSSTVNYIQIEKGNKASDWSPNPEDLRLEIVENKNYVDAIKSDLQSQIDGNITSWFFDYEPTLYNEPASNWSQEGVREIHLGDLFYWTSKGYSYRFQKVGTVYSWTRIADTDVTKAMADAAAAQDTADSKRRVFTSQPVTPYDEGDLWTQGAGGEILTCNVPRPSGAFVASDWGKAAKWTDDTAVNNLQIGGRNLVLQSNVQATGVGALRFYNLSEPLVVGETYAVSVKGNVGAGAIFKVWVDKYNTPVLNLTSSGIAKGTFVFQGGSFPSEISVYSELSSNPSTVFWVQIEKGNKATDHTVAPEDIQAEIAEADYLKTALKGSTEISGGLVATNVLLMKDAAGTTRGGMSGIASDNVGVWTGGTYAEAIAATAKNILFKNGSFRLAGGDVVYDINQLALTISALIRTSATGARVEISKESNSITIYDANNAARMKFAPKNVMAFDDITGNITTVTTTYSAHSNSISGSGTTTIGSTELLILDPTKYYDITTPAIAYDLYAIGFRDGVTKENFVGSASVEIRLVDTLKNTVAWVSNIQVSSGTTTPATNFGTVAPKTIIAISGSTYRIDVVLTANNEGNGSDGMAEASIAAGQTLIGTTMVNFSEMGLNGFNFINDNAHFLHYGPDVFAYKGALNFPGVLASGSVASMNSHTNKWGAKVATDAQSVTKGGTGIYNVPHNLGNSAFTVLPVSTTDNINCRVTEKTNTNFQVTCRNMSGTLTDAGFDYIMVGSN